MKSFKYRLPWQPNHQIVSYFTKKSIFKARHLPWTKDQIEHLLRNQHLILNIKFKLTNELSQFMLPWQPKHHTIKISQKSIFNKKGIFYTNYLLPAWQNMNYFQHILHNFYLLYKYTNNSFKDSRLELPWQQLQEMPQKFLTLWPKNMTNIEICPRKIVKLKPFRLIWVFLWLHLQLALFRWPH